MRLLYTVCGRAGSKGVKSKNSGMFQNVPIVNYTLAVIALYGELNPQIDTTIALNTDSNKLRTLVRNSGLDIFDAARSPHLATDSASKVDVVADTLWQVEREGFEKYDLVVDLDITSPLRTVADVERVVAKAMNSDADVVFTVAKSRRNPCFNMVVEGEDGYYRRVLPSTFTARQQAPVFYDMNASIYAYKPDFLHSGCQIFEGRCSIVEMRDTAVLDIDEPNDLELMEAVASRLVVIDPSLEAVFIRAKEIAC